MNRSADPMLFYFSEQLIGRAINDEGFVLNAFSSDPVHVRGRLETLKLQDLLSTL